MGNHGYSMDPNAYPDPDQDRHASDLPEADRLDEETITTIHDILRGIQEAQADGPVNRGAEFCQNHPPSVTPPLPHDPEHLISISVLSKGTAYSSSMATSWRCCSNCAVVLIMDLARALYQMELLPAPPARTPRPPRSRRPHRRIPKS